MARTESIHPSTITRNRICVLYIHPAGPFGGASKSLLDCIEEMNGIDPKLICQRGETARRAKAQGIDTIESAGLSQIDNTTFGGYRGLRKIIILRELIFFPYTLIALIQARMRWKSIEVVHVNEVTLVLVVPLIRILYPRIPIIVHVRSTQQPLNSSLKSRLIFWILKHYVIRVVPIDETVRATLPVSLPTTIIHNGFAPRLPLDFPLLRPTRRAQDPLVLSYVGGLIIAKGVLDLVEAAYICRQRGLNLSWKIFGENVRTVKGLRAYLLKFLGFNTDVRAQILELIKLYGLEGIITLEGYQSDYSRIYSETDVVLCITHANAASRPVFEGAFFGCPSIVAIDKPSTDTVIDEVTAICIPPRSPNHLADAITRINSDRSLLERMGRAAFVLANNNFTIERCARRLKELYVEVIFDNKIVL